MTGGKETNQDVLSSGERSGHRSNLKSGGPRIFRIVVLRSIVEGASSWYKSSGKGTTWRVRVPSATTAERRRSSTFRRVGLFGNAAQTGDRSHPKLNTRRRPIAKKYSDGNFAQVKEGTRIDPAGHVVRPVSGPYSVGKSAYESLDSGAALPPPSGDGPSKGTGDRP